MKKALISDFDRTLVGNEHKIPNRSLSAIKTLIKSGVIFTIATGRGYQGVVSRECKRMGLDVPVIVRGGSEIVNTQDDQVMWAKFITPSTVTAIVEYFLDNDLNFAVEQGEYFYLRENDPFAKNLGEGAPLKNIDEFVVGDTPKIVLFPELPKHEAEEIERKLTNAYSNIHLAMIHKGKDGYGFDINSVEAGKHVAVVEFSKMINVDPSEIIAVGDSYNDYPLLSACGTKVAMGNAVDELKEIADFIAPSYKDEGIIDVIEKFFS